jgi:hypothetical protein
MSLVLPLSLAAALALAVTAVLSKQLTAGLPARQLIGPLLLLNAMLLLPVAPFVTWQLTPRIAVLHLVEVVLLVVSSVAVWDLLANGEASSTVTAQSLSPLPATVAVALVLPATFNPGQAVAAAIVVMAVLAGLSDAFPSLGRRRTLARLALTAVATGSLTVTSRLLADLGVGIVPTYVVRTLVAATAVLVLFPPVDIQLRQLPQLATRAVFVTAHFLFVLARVSGLSRSESCE